MSWQAAWDKSQGPHSIKDKAILLAKGFAMGVADIIPGVSGGTIAFITGIYEQLIAAVTSLDGRFIKNILTLKWQAAVAQSHFKFLVPLVFGILFAMLTMARLMHFLLNEYTIWTWSFFFGLILASVYIVGKQVPSFVKPKNFLFFVVGVVIAYLVVSLIPIETPESYWFIFLCGMIGITAMILPGISGSFILLILGKYEFITGHLKQPSLEGLPILFIFVCGTVTGLLSFSRLLKYCLERFHNQTMMILTGFMLGSLKKIWPWKEVLETKVIRGKVRILREANFLPAEINDEVMIAIFVMLMGLITVVGIEKLAHQQKSLPTE